MARSVMIGKVVSEEKSFEKLLMTMDNKEDRWQGWWKPIDGNSSHGRQPGELKREIIEINP